MRFYADSSLLVSAFTAEPASEKARAWLRDLPLGSLVTSSWCLIEIASALAIKARREEIDESAREPTFRSMEQMLRNGATLIALAESHFTSATSFIRSCDTPLRGPDALHLAIAQSAGAVVWTFDGGMADAGRALGLDTQLLA